MNSEPRIGIIGGGAAGMMAAATILESGIDCRITLFDKNKHLGAKVIISGGGRCNVTTGLQDVKTVLKKYTRGSDFLKAALSKFTPAACYSWFEEHGVPLKIEKDLRVFPKSNNGKDIVGIFEHLFTTQLVTLMLGTNVMAIKKNNGTYEVTSSSGTHEFDYIVITTGGNAFSHTGSSGDGYAFARALGHSITPLGPSLNSFETKETWPAELSGLSFENALLKTKNPKIAVSGPFLFTHFGISGPVTFSLSSHLSHEEISAEHPIEVSLFPKAERGYAEWEEILINDLETSSKKSIKNILTAYFAQRFVDGLLAMTKISPSKKASEVSKSDRQKIAHLLGGGLVLTLIRRRQGDEFVTAGGVDTDEINKQTMESLISPGLYFAGEVMNVDGLTGGFNLQASWATGKLAGVSIIKAIKKK